MAAKTHKITLEFRTKDDACATFDAMKAAGLLADDVALYQSDALDAGRAHPGDYIVKRRGVRPDQFLVSRVAGDNHEDGDDDE